MLVLVPASLQTLWTGIASALGWAQAVMDHMITASHLTTAYETEDRRLTQEFNSDLWYGLEQ